MLLIPQIKINGDLLLTAYSFSADEMNSVVFVLEKSRIKATIEIATFDRERRRGLQFIILALDIVKLERTLGINFSGRADKTRVTLVSDGQGQSYKCSRIDTPPNSCETIYANDEKEAIVKCALVAHNNNWLGGVPTRGRC